MSKHTPGPWKLQADNSRRFPVWVPEAGMPRIVAESGHHVAYLMPNGLNDLDKHGLANARLIAAAPDLLESCRSVLRGDYRLTDAAHAAITGAIAKAEG